MHRYRQPSYTHNTPYYGRHNTLMHTNSTGLAHTTFIYETHTIPNTPRMADTTFKHTKYGTPGINYNRPTKNNTYKHNIYLA